MSVKVVKVNSQQSNFTDYIGRDWAGLPKSIFHNPFRIGKDGDRQDVLLKFIEYWYAPEQKLLRQTALLWLDDNAILGCWCHPLSCHGHIIAAYVNWKRRHQETFDWL